MICPKQITDNFSNTNTKSKMKIHIPESPIPGRGVQFWWPRVQGLVPVIQGSGGSFASVDPCCLLHLSPSKQCFHLSPSMQCITICWFGVDRMYGGHLVPHRPPSIQPLFDAANFTQLFSLQTRSK